ncbi:hypothetical protein F5X68DRAFT_229525 [Plectosphaerella plurivora]|uniref:Zn(2)-C6 fungal-type domain-containing protein n=1 Tax=Plectosphaerella plurivora TaxID=936078 RepID=A0A9P8VFU9_9PEZI|nr:hypothetical protein F5X68DRAFT_229525 [Plectosphaerella plurivora]
MSKRPRACDACQKLKAKCDFSTSGPCSRCERVGIECVPAAPRFQRDRIAELEAQLHELRVTPTDDPVAFVNARMSFEMQQRVLADFASQVLVVWPFLSAADMDLDHLRATAPHLLLAIMAFPGKTGLPGKVQDELVVKAMSMFGNEIIAKGNRSLQMVKALLTAAFWVRQARYSPHGHCYQLVQLAVDMAIDIGIAGPQLARSPPAYFSATNEPTSIDARRTWVACFLAATAQSLGTRRTPYLVWMPYLEDCVQHLEGHGDRLLSQIVRIVGITSDTARQLDLYNHTAHRSVDQLAEQMAVLRGRVAAWHDQIPADLALHPLLCFWKEVAPVLIHEVVLHTPTNKASFAAPYVPEKLPVTDFAAPSELTPEVGRTLHRLVEACHAAIQRFAEMDTSMMLAPASLSIGPAVLYAHFLLTQTHVAVTGQGNSLGSVMGPSDVALAVSMQKLEDVSRALDLVDPYQASFTTTMLKSSSWMRTWLKDYDAIVARYIESVAQTQRRGAGTSYSGA